MFASLIAVSAPGSVEAIMYAPRQIPSTPPMLLPIAIALLSLPTCTIICLIIFISVDKKKR